jgi:hypothetical protein
MLADTFYTFETLADRDTLKAVSFDFEIGVNSPTNIRTCRVYLAEDSISSTEAVYNVFRNYWYNLYVNIIDPGLDSVRVEVIVNPWNVADTIPIIIGDGYSLNLAQPFKLVKYYSADDTIRYPGSSRMLAIDSHSQGASWMDLSVSDGTDWDLTFTADSRNTGAIFSADTGKTWVTSLAGVGDDVTHRIYIYRPYVENSEDYRNGPVATLRVRDNTKVGSPMQTVETIVVQPRDSLIFPTNSYVLRPFEYSGFSLSEAYIPLKPVYDFWENFIYENGVTIPAGAPTVSLDWKDKSGDVIQNQTNIAVINPNNRNESYIKVEAGPVQGNAVIVFRINGDIYWSYHLWVTEYSPYEPAGQILYKTPVTNDTVRNVFMDRNLGAMDTLYNAAGNFPGIPYQFGNKNPNVFYETTYWDVNNASHSSELITSAISAATTVLRPRESIPAMLHATRHPILGGMVDVTVEEPYIWRTKGGNKTAYDPCPEGYRVPQQETFGVTNSPWNGATFQEGTGIFQQGFYSNALNYFPRNYIDGGSGSNTTVFNSAYYWTSFWAYNPSAPVEPMAYGMLLSSATPVANPFAATSKATGAYIRCTVDKNYLERREGNKFGRYAADILDDL